MYKWVFSISDNSGKRQSFTVKANSKQEAIAKGFEKARKHANGDLSLHWTCDLQRGV